MNLEDTWARRCFNIASATLEPMCTVVWCGFRMTVPFSKFDCRVNTVQEVALRALYLCTAALLVIPAMPLAGISQLFRCAGWALQKRGYTHVRGNADVKEKEFSDAVRVKVMTFNIAAVPAGISYKVAGVPDWRLRLDEIIKRIRDASPDVLVIQETYDTAVQEELVCRLKDLYPHFFLHLGVGAFGGLGPGGVMMATKGAVGHFSDHPFRNNAATQCRSFGSLELLHRPGGSVFARFIGTHLTWREAERQAREQQWLQIREHIQERNNQRMIPTFIAADMNVERDQEGGKKLSEWVQFYYTEAAPTCWHQLPLEWKKDDQFKAAGCVVDSKNYRSNRPRQIDNILYVRVPECKDVKLIRCDRIESYRDPFSTRLNDPRKLFDTRTAVSDHHAVIAEMQIGCALQSK